MTLKHNSKLPKYSIPSVMRSQNMAHIRANGNKTTELRLKMALVRSRISGWKMKPVIIGSPDFFFLKKKIAVFVDGCFWHDCPRCGHIPKTNSRYWKAKIAKNKTRDRLVLKTLKEQGLLVIRIWEHSLKNKTGFRKVMRMLAQNSAKSFVMA